MEICALGITAPEASVTVPDSVAPATWARAWTERSVVSTTKTNAKILGGILSENVFGAIVVSWDCIVMMSSGPGKLGLKISETAITNDPCTEAIVSLLESEI